MSMKRNELAQRSAWTAMQEPLQEYAECLRFRQDEITAGHGIGERDVKSLLFLMTSMTKPLCEYTWWVA